MTNLTPILEDAHYKVLIPFIQNPDNEDRALFAFRDMGKTSVVARKIMQDVFNDPNERILFVSDMKGRAEHVTDMIRMIFATNKLLKWAFPDILWQDPDRKQLYNPEMKGETPRMWSPGRFTVKREIDVPDATITAATLNPMPTGGHYTRIYFDDLEVPENTMTDEQLAKTKESFGYFFAMLSASSSDISVEGSVFVSGTIYDANDLHSELLNDPDFKCKIISAYLTPDVAEEMGLPYLGKNKSHTCPKRMGEKALNRRRKRMTEYIFSCQYLQDPSNSRAALYKEEYLAQRYLKMPEHCVFATIVDPAGEEKTTTGESAVLTVGIDEKENVYFFRGNRGNYDAPALCRTILLHRKLCRALFGRASEVGIEQAALQAAFKSVLEQMTDEAFVVKDLRHGSKNWFMRAYPMATRAQNMKLFFPDKDIFPDEQWWVDAIIRQLVKTTKTKKKGEKDWWDCVAYIDQMICNHHVRAPLTGKKAHTGTDGTQIEDDYIGY